MNNTTSQNNRFQGLLDFFIDDEQKRQAMRNKAEDFGAASAMMQQFVAPQPMPLQNTGGLLQQPQMVQMAPYGKGMMSMPSEGDEEQSKLSRLMTLIGMA